MTMLKTSRYDFSLPPPRTSSTKTNSAKSDSTNSNSYYYYIYRKKIDPNSIKGPEDLPVPPGLRRNNLLKLEGITSSLPKLNDSDLKESREITPLVASTKKRSRHKRSNSLPEDYKENVPNTRHPYYRERRTARARLRPLQSQNNRQVELKGSSARPLPHISKRRQSSAQVLLPEENNSKVLMNSLKHLIGETTKGLKWSRHTIVYKGNHGSTEKTTEVQVKKTFKDGKWVEEKTETVTITNPKGNATTKSQKISYRDLEPNEVTPTAVELPDKVSIESPRASRPATTSKTVTAPIKISRPVRKDQKDDLESFSRQVLSAVNVHRKTHGAPALHISAKLTKMAKEWAEKLAKLEKIEHGGNKNIGENIYCKTSSEPFFEVKVEEVVQNWYSEVEDHSYDEEPKAGYIKTGHFTQLVWRETTEMGISYARNKNGHMAFVVAYFSPKGNWIGEFKKQVLPSGSELPAKKLTSTAQKYGFKTTPTMAEENFYEDFLRTHNNYRNKHGVKPLRYNEKLSKFAQEWAENNARRGKMEHRRENEYGENIYKKWSTKPNHKVSGEEAVHSWYEEINQYEFGKEPLDLSAGHFTQMIWSDSEELGVGIASSKTGENVFVVANYNPPGNYIGQFSQKVPSPK